MRPTGLPKMMIGFVIRRCAVAVGHDPSPEEFAQWANEYREAGRRVSLFGRPISIDEARLILKHRGRPVSARSAAPHEILVDEAAAPARLQNVMSLSEARERRAAKAKL